MPLPTRAGDALEAHGRLPRVQVLAAQEAACADVGPLGLWAVSQMAVTWERGGVCVLISMTVRAVCAGLIACKKKLYVLGFSRLSQQRTKKTLGSLAQPHSAHALNRITHALCSRRVAPVR